MNTTESISGLELKILDVKNKQQLEDYFYLLERQKEEQASGFEISEDYYNYSVLYEHIILAYVNDVPVGYTSGSKENKTFYVSMTYVVPEYRKNGIGRKLKERQEELAKRLGAESIETTVSKDNEASLRLQESSGFKLFPDSLRVSYKAVKKL